TKELIAVESTAATKKKEDFTKEDQEKIRKATLMSIIPGGGQFYNKQLLKGIVFFVIFLSFLLQLFGFGFEAIEGLITLGTTPREDHSLFLLIEGVLQLLVIFLFLAFYGVQIYDAN